MNAVQWWANQPDWIRWPLYLAGAAGAGLWLYVLWLYRPHLGPGLAFTLAAPVPGADPELAALVAGRLRHGLTPDGHTDEATRWDRLDAAGWTPGTGGTGLADVARVLPRIAPDGAGASVDWSPAEVDALVGQSPDMTADAVAHARAVESEVRAEVAARLDAERAHDAFTDAEAGTWWELASIELDRMCAARIAKFAAACDVILAPWQARAAALMLATREYPIVFAVPAAAPARPIKPATGRRARRNRKRIHQGKDPR